MLSRGSEKPATVVVSVPAAAAATGAVEEPFMICSARIPKGFDSGTAVVAVQTCQRDETGRASMQAVPGSIMLNS
jgi:hypothetical protein